MNLLYADVPADIYQVVADKTIAKLEAIIGCQKRNSANSDTPEDEVSDAQLAQWWLEFGITRKITKRNCMCGCQKTKSAQIDTLPE